MPLWCNHCLYVSISLSCSNRLPLPFTTRHGPHPPAPGQQPLVHEHKRTLHLLLRHGPSCHLQDQKEEQRAKRRRLLSAAASARIRRGMIRYLQVGALAVHGWALSAAA